MSIDRIIEMLVEAESIPNGFNPFWDHCPENDLTNAVKIRRNNLKIYLEAQLKLKPKSLWIGEAPGYNGVRRSGMYLISEPQFKILSERLNCQVFQRATHGMAKATATSKQVWKMIQLLDEIPLTFDAYPFHLMQDQPPFKNRSPKKAELRQYAFVLEALIQCFQPKKILSIGRKAQYALESIGIESVYVRHPSRGGQKEFEQGIRGIYGI